MGMHFCAALAVSLAASSAADAESYLMRFADVHDDKVVFTYEGDLWVASTSGGNARRITNDQGVERSAKFSPDGKRLAFTANYDGGSDVYVMDAEGGVPTRLTYHPAGDGVLDWFPDGEHILFRSRRQFSFRGEQIYKVPASGGMEERLPVDRAGLTALSPDGKWVAYNRISREFATWKRHEGGTQQEIWMGNFETGDFQLITDWRGTDNYPMWSGDAIYFASDRQYGTLNIYKYDIRTRQVTRLTSYKDYDVKYPSIGPGAIVFQYGEQLHLLDLNDGRTRKLDITIPTDSADVRATYVSSTANARSFGLSPSGARMLLEVRGEIFNVPAKQGEPINLTKSSASREKDAVWSPDKRWVAFLSDKTGEEEVYLVDQKAQQPWRQLTKGGKGWRTDLVWSPDSKWLLFGDKYMKLNLVNAESGELELIDQGEYDDGWYRWGIRDHVWSPDSKWIAYAKQESNLNQSIFLYSLADKKVYRVTSPMTQDWGPSFDPKGRYLYFLSERTFSPIMDMVDQNFIFLDMARPYIVILAADGASPFAPEDSQEEVKAEEEKPAEGEKTEEAKEGEEKAEEKPVEAKAEKEEEKKEEKKGDVKIDPYDFERRTIAAVGVPAGNYFRLEATEKGFLYLKKDEPQFEKYQKIDDETTDSVDLYYYEVEQKDPAERKPKKLIGGINNYHQSADGKKMVYRGGETYGVVDVTASAAVGDGKVDLGGVKLKIDKLAEFMQIFNEAWRVQRDWFYDPGLHGMNWDAVGEMYRRFVPSCGNRDDLNYLIGEMIGELNAGHTYIYGGELGGNAKSIPIGLLGADFETPPTAEYHRIAHIIPGTSWNENERSPLAEPGCPVLAGDYLIAIDGRDIKSTDNVYKYLEQKAGRVVTLTYNSKPTPEGAKTHRLRTIGGEEAIRYREWVDKNRAAVDKASDGKIGYLHIPDMGASGCIEFSRDFFAQHDKPALLIDVRYNGGGFTGDMIIDRLERRLWSITQPREGKTIRNPERTFYGHIAVLINEDTGSNGEYFSEALKIKGLAKLIGMRTWGGAIGIEPHQILVDGGTCTPPQFAPYGLDGKWLIEGVGVIPDVPVQNMPGDVLKGKDAQLETGIAYLKEQLTKEPMAIPPTPPYPKKPKPAN